MKRPAVACNTCDVGETSMLLPFGIDHALLNIIVELPSRS